MEKSELDTILREEKVMYLGEDISRIKQMKKSQNRRYVIWCYLVAFRKCQFWKEIRESNDTHGLKRKIAKVCYHYFDTKRNLLSERCGVEIGINSHVGKKIDLWHGGIVINGDLGDNCTLHGNNIIGNKGKGRENEFPIIGNHVDIGAGANIIGKIVVASNTVIGAGAMVTKNSDKTGAILIGVPAKDIGIKEEA